MRPQSDRPVSNGSRVAILDAAGNLFAALGYSGTSTANIAKAAGVTRTLIFHYFPTKQALLTTLLHERGLGAVLDKITVPPRKADVETALLALAAQIKEHLHLSEQLLQIVLHERSIQPLTQRLYGHFMNQLQALVEATLANALESQANLTTTRAAANTFAAVLLRDILLEPLTGASGGCEQAAGICALALAGQRAQDRDDGNRSHPTVPFSSTGRSEQPCN
jgi:AcrR family transcriptional regulator